MGKLFAARDYELKFIYGGFGYFDNMNYFFEHNGFQIVDRTKFEKNEIDFSNIWGVSDENLFQKVIKESDKSYKQNRPFFNFVLTTSNHRPFTFPEGRIDLTKNDGRDGGVKYTDYAIGKFLEEAKKKPWFNNTVFVIVADHCASGKGKTEISLPKYHIPLMIYAPELIPAKKVDTLASQIDIAPTVASLLNFSYSSKFFGKDILTMKKEDERLVLGTYQYLGYYKNNTLVKLSPGKKSDFFYVSPDQKGHLTSEYNSARLNESIGYYQYASYLVDHNLYN